MSRPTPELDAFVADALAAAGLAGRRFRLLELVRSEVDADARALLVFVDAGREPAVFVKLAWGSRGAVLATEYANLERLSASGDDRLASSVPRPLLFRRNDAFSALAVAAVPFRRMKDLPPQAYFRSAGFARTLVGVADWLARFHRAFVPSVEEPPLDPAAEVGRFREAYRTSAALDLLLDASADRLVACLPQPSPWHGDFCTANLLVAPDETVRIVDWEWPLVGGWPLGDYLHFAASVWCAPYGKGPAAREESLRRLYFESSPLTDRLVASARRLAESLGVERDLLLPLSVLVWVAFANRKRELIGAADLTDDEVAASHLPLVVVRGGACRNLELLAERPERYRIGRVDT